MDRITVEQLGELIAQSKGENSRVTRLNLQAFLRNPNGYMRAGVYPVVVDYGKSVEEMVLVARYDSSDEDINFENFPVSGEGKINVNLELVHLNKEVSSEGVLAYLEENGMSPATVEELLAFGATYPKVQRKFSIICLGSSWIDLAGHRFAPCLLRHSSKRNLYLHYFDNTWSKRCRFLAVRK